MGQVSSVPEATTEPATAHSRQDKQDKSPQKQEPQDTRDIGDDDDMHAVRDAISEVKYEIMEELKAGLGISTHTPAIVQSPAFGTERGDRHLRRLLKESQSPTPPRSRSRSTSKSD
jgi:hypothetical protein